jgi:class 3 adenylate cyclase
MADGTQRRLAAIVSADVVGYSRLMGVDEAGTLAALRKHRAELIDGKIAVEGKLAQAPQRRRPDDHG